MKRGFYAFFSLALLALVALVGNVSAASSTWADCTMDITLLNQDPIKAVPGEYVDVVFQLQGVDNPACGTVTFEIRPEYPFSLDPGVETTKIIHAGTFTSDYNSQATIPFSLRVDSTALDDKYPVKVRYTSGTSDAYVQKQFDIDVENVKTNFEIFVDDYAPATNTITFSILNVGKNDVEALTVQANRQPSLDVKGSNKAIVGTLDANQDTTFTYEATPSDGNITLTVLYNDENGERRSMEKTVVYDSTYFTGRARDAKQGSSVWTWIILIVIVGLIVWWWLRRRAKKKKMQQR